MTQFAQPRRDQQVLSVTDLNRQARITIEEQFHQVWVLGELSNFAKPRSGHWYFTLKDDRAQVRCAMFVNRNRSVQLQPADGHLVIVRGRVSLYEGRGDFQIIVDHMEAAGEGALRQAFDRLKVKLSEEGLFDPDRKHPLPAFPTHCVVVSSLTGAALKDVLAVWQRRFPSLRVTVIPTAVQGEAAEAQLLEAIATADALHPDVLLLTRGGGSLEDLWSFNLESVARALARCKAPTVSAIGHEIDTTICDYVADLRAPTPSVAAELITPNRDDVIATVMHHHANLRRSWHQLLQHLRLHITNLKLQVTSPRHILEQAAQTTDDVAQRMRLSMAHKIQLLVSQTNHFSQQLSNLGPEAQIAKASDRVAHQDEKLRSAMTRALHQHRQTLRVTARMLENLSPLPTIARGYAISMSSSRRVLTSTSQVTTGQDIVTYLGDGAFNSTVTKVKPGEKL